jgi:hypothetical protein
MSPPGMGNVNRPGEIVDLTQSASRPPLSIAMERPGTRVRVVGEVSFFGPQSLRWVIDMAARWLYAGTFFHPPPWSKVI